MPAVETSGENATRQVIPGSCPDHHEQTALLVYLGLVKDTQVETTTDKIDHHSH